MWIVGETLGSTPRLFLCVQAHFNNDCGFPNWVTLLGSISNETSSKTVLICTFNFPPPFVAVGNALAIRWQPDQTVTMEK